MDVPLLPFAFSTSPSTSSPLIIAVDDDSNGHQFITFDQPATSNGSLWPQFEVDFGSGFESPISVPGDDTLQISPTQVRVTMADAGGFPCPWRLLTPGTTISPSPATPQSGTTNVL
jgi:hypothetical protein